MSEFTTFPEHVNGNINVIQSPLLSSFESEGLRHGWFDNSLGNTMPRSVDPKHPDWISDFLTEEELSIRWQQAADSIGVDYSRLVKTTGLLQTDKVLRVTEDDAGKTIGKADAYISDVENLPIMLRAADCQVAFFYDPVLRVIGACHSGFLGTKKASVANTALQMYKEFGCAPENLKVAIGPAIGGESFIPSEDPNKFDLSKMYFPHGVKVELPNGKEGFDIRKTTQRQLIAMAGIPEENIEISNIDTQLDPRFFSFNRVYQESGGSKSDMRRNASIISLQSREDL
ncbi:MAG TPA: laccase domain-containing protein [Candidatus Dormibacteraeota bacterium]|nr:laccase domain-containing protein [Candidatus Dormibacteraeota bacterium]